MTTRVCDWCRKEFAPSGVKRFCGRECANEAQRKPLTEKFWARVSKGAGCWLWTGAKFQESGYGQITLRINSKPTPRGAHRVSWEIHNGTIPDGLLVLHRCDNKLCVRPDHLFVGTHADNMEDMKAKGRAASGNRNAARLHPDRVARGDRHSSRTKPERTARGERGGRAKLTEPLVKEIRERFGQPGVTVSQLSRDYGVSRTLIRNIANRRIWTHI